MLTFSDHSSQWGRFRCRTLDVIHTVSKIYWLEYTFRFKRDRSFYRVWILIFFIKAFSFSPSFSFYLWSQFSIFASIFFFFFWWKLWDTIYFILMKIKKKKNKARIIHTIQTDKFVILIPSFLFLSKRWMKYLFFYW